MDRVGKLLINTSTEQRTAESTWKDTATHGKTTGPSGGACILELRLEP